MQDSQFFCTRCGKLGIPIQRKNGRKREAGHLKKLWCLNCKDEVNHVEVKMGTHYSKEDFDLEFTYGNFDEKGNRIYPYGIFKTKVHNGEITLKGDDTNE